MFGQAPSTSPFGAPAPAPFGSPAPSGGFGTSTFGAAAPAPAPFSGFGQPAAAPSTVGFGAAPASAFGTTSTFGQPAAAPSAFGQPAPAPAFGSATGGFGAAPAPAFGAPAPATGSLFGSAAPAPAFGAKPAGTSLFGSSPAPSGGLFGNAPAPATGGLFGGAPAAAPFGSPAPATPFGPPAPAPSAFGAPAAPAFGAPAPSAFGAAPAAAGGFGQTQQPQVGTTVAPYQSTTKQDGTNQIVLQAISAMSQYEQKSFEELRLEDYLAGNKGMKGQAAPATAGFGGFGAAAPQPAPAFGAAPAPAFGATPATGGLFSNAPAPAPSGGLFGASAPAPAFGAAPASTFAAAPAPSTLFGGAPAPTSAGGLFGSSAAAPAFGAAPAPAFGAANPSPAAGSLFGSAPAPAFGAAPQPAPAFGAAPAPAGGLFGAAATAPPTAGLFGSTTPAPASGGLFGQPAPAPSLFGQPAPVPATGGLFGASPAKPGGLFGSAAPAPAPTAGLFGQTPAPATGGLFGQSPAPTAPAAGAGLFGSTITATAPAVPVPPPPSAEALLAQQLAAVENQKKQLELLDAWRGHPPSGSKVVPASLYDDESDKGWNGSEGSSLYGTSSSALLSYRAGPRSAAKIRPRGFTPKQSSVTALGKKLGSPILSPNRFVGSVTKALFIKPDSLTPKPKTRLLLTDGVSNGSTNPSSSPAALEYNGYDSPDKSNLQTQKLKISTQANDSQSRQTGSIPALPSVAGTGSPLSPAHDLYRQVVDSTTGDGSSPSPTAQLGKNFVPKLTKQGYVVYPSVAELEVMTEADLAAIVGFKVERPGYGSVAWDGAVDVRGVDIDKVVVIERKNVSVYDEAEEDGTKPQQGSKLNRPAIITMYKIYPKDGAGSSAESKARLKRKIEKSTKKMGAELISFEEESGTWQFRVGHFSRYGLDDTDDSEDEECSDNELNATPSLMTMDDEQETVDSVEFMRELGGAPKIKAPYDEDDSTSACTDNMSVAETIDPNESERGPGHDEVVQAGEVAYAKMKEAVLEDYEDEKALALHDELVVNESDGRIVPFPEDEGHGLSLPIKQPLRPKISYSRLAHSTEISNILASKCGLTKTSGSNTDYGFSMRRSFRIGWRPDGSFVQLRPFSNGGQILVQSRPDISPLSPEKPKNQVHSSLPLLETHRKHSVDATRDSPNNQEAPIFTLPKGISLHNALEEYSKSSASCSFNSATKHAVMNSFSLLMCLYGGNKSANLSTRGQSCSIEALSTWLKGVVSKDTARAVSAAQSSGDIYGSIFAALSGGDFTTASKLSYDSGNPCLALIVANSGKQPFCHRQLELWQKSGAQLMTPTSILRILSLASGSIDTERGMYKSDRSFYKIDWKRRFGMSMWWGSSCQDKVTVAAIVEQYGSDVLAGQAPPATPCYCGDASDVANTCILYQVLNYYVEGNSALASILSPSSHTQFHHDFSASFHLGAILTSLSSSELKPHQEDLIVDAISSQLIREGLWEWAVYANLCFIGGGPVSKPAAFVKRLRAKNIISRFFSPSSDPSAESRRLFLEAIGIPPQWFSEAHMYRSASEGEIIEMLNRFPSEASKNVVVDVVVPHMILEGKDSTTKLQQILKELSAKISGDPSIVCMNEPHGCEIMLIRKFLDLQTRIENKNGNVDMFLHEINELETGFLKVEENIRMKSLLFAKIPYWFSEVPQNIVIAETLTKLSLLRMKLLAIKNGSFLHKPDCGPELSFTLADDGLFQSTVSKDAESILRRFCGFKTLS